MERNKSGQSIQVLVLKNGVPYDEDTANLVGYESIDDGAVTALGGGTPTVPTKLDATNAIGMFSFDLSQAETDGEQLVFTGVSSTEDVYVVPLIVFTVPEGFSDIIKLLMADRKIELNGNDEYEEVWYEEGTSTELMRKPLLTTTGDPVTAITDVIGSVGGS